MTSELFWALRPPLKPQGYICTYLRLIILSYSNLSLSSTTTIINQKTKQSYFTVQLFPLSRLVAVSPDLFSLKLVWSHAWTDLTDMLMKMHELPSASPFN